MISVFATRVWGVKCTHHFCRSSWSSSSSSSSVCTCRTRKLDSQKYVFGRFSMSSVFPPIECEEQEQGEEETSVISLKEWQGWGTSSNMPSMVVDIINDMKNLEKDLDSEMVFGGLGGKLQGDFRAQEDRKHRAMYGALTDPEDKLQMFSARQIACRLLGSRGYLCQKCWLAMEDCMCSKLVTCSLWDGMRFWLYMHPKDFLRQNNTGKLLWQIFGVQAATLCLFGVREHEDVMWDSFRHAGINRVWCLYPNKNEPTKRVEDIFYQRTVDSENQSKKHVERPLNFILIDGTWSNSAAMFARLKKRAHVLWGKADFPCISLVTDGASAMHKLRPQPSRDRTCTAAAASGLLSELHALPQFSSHCLDKQAETLENGIDVLLDALTDRRRRMGRSITRKERKTNDI